MRERGGAQRNRDKTRYIESGTEREREREEGGGGGEGGWANLAAVNARNLRN